jgi:hypothetical protein
MTVTHQRGMICLQCEDEGPCLVVTPPDDLPDDVRVFLEFDCGVCGRRWQWSLQAGVYHFEREVIEE